MGKDLFGPYKGITISTFRDKASGFGCSAVMKNKYAKDIVIVLQNLVSFFAKHGHHKNDFNSPIQTLKADSESIYKSKLVKDFCNSNGINTVYSPPYAHEYNGLIESHNKIIANKVTILFSAAPWVPEILWPYAWSYADKITNLTCSKRNSLLSKEEDFTVVKPNFKNKIFLPFGQPVEVLIPKEQRVGKFGAHSLCNRLVFSPRSGEVDPQLSGSDHYNVEYGMDCK